MPLLIRPITYFIDCVSVCVCVGCALCKMISATWMCSPNSAFYIIKMRAVNTPQIQEDSSASLAAGPSYCRTWNMMLLSCNDAH